MPVGWLYLMLNVSLTIIIFKNMDDITLEQGRKLQRDINRHQEFISSLNKMIKYGNSKKFRIKYWCKRNFRLICKQDDIIENGIDIPLEIAEEIVRLSENQRDSLKKKFEKL